MTRTTTPARRAPKLLAAAVAGAALVATALPAQAAASPDEQLRENKQTAAEVVTALATGRVGVLRDDVLPGYVDHAVPGTSGLDALVAATRAAHRANPRSSTRIYRVLGQGDLVFVHSNLKPDPAGRGFAVADVFRFENGKVAEHWGGRQAVPATTASGNDMFSTLSSPVRLSPDPAADPAVTQSVVFGLFGVLVGQKDLSAWDAFVQPPYYQHSVNTGNGIAAVKAVWGPIITDPDMVITLVNLVVDHDLVVSQTFLTTPTSNTLSFDISRIRNGKIVEHWDVIQKLS